MIRSGQRPVHGSHSDRQTSYPETFSEDFISKYLGYKNSHLLQKMDQFSLHLQLKFCPANVSYVAHETKKKL